MIVEMRKGTILFLHSDRDTILTDLQKLGLVEVDQTHEVTSERLTSLQEFHERDARHLEELAKISRFWPQEAQAAKLQRETKTNGRVLAELEELMRDLGQLLRKRRRYVLRLERLKSDEKRLLPWGDFDLARVRNLAQAGLHIRFWEASEEKFDQYGQSENFSASDSKAANGALVEEINRMDGQVYYLVFEYEDSGAAKGGSKEQRLPGAKEVHLPEISLEETGERMQRVKSEIEETDCQLRKYVPHLPLLENYLAAREDEIEFVKAGLYAQNLDQKAESICRCDLWFAQKNEKEVSDFFLHRPVWYQAEKPAPGDRVPVILKNISWVRPFETITRIFSLPDYFEIDPTPFFAPFFALFFGLCVADLGYGLLITLLSTVYYFRAPRKWKSVAALGSLLGASTILGGVWLNTVYGANMFRLPGLEESLLSAAGSGAALLGPYRESGKMVFPSMSFALFTGFLQLSLGLVLQAYKKWKNGAIYSLQTFGFLGLMYGGLVLSVHANVLDLAGLNIAGWAAGSSLLKIPKAAGTVLFWGGLALVALFNNPEKRFVFRPAFALWELYGFTTALLGDLLSYLRLFALGLAGGLLGNAFNNIAFMFVTGPSGQLDITPGGVALMAPVLVLGHVLNMGLALLGGFVHSLRLTFVEFYRHFEFEGGGKPFLPFRLQNDMTGRN